MESSTCSCGKRMSKYYYNSTIKRKHCPRCEMLNKIDGSYDALKKSFAEKKRRGGSSSPKKSKKSPKSLAMNNADLWFSRYIRIKYSYKIQDGEVYCQCIVSPNIIKLAKNVDNGHGYSRDFKSTRYYEDNCRPQNRSSNRFSGEADHYKFLDNLAAEIGEERFEKLNKLRRKEGEDNETFYKEQSTKYRKLVNQLIKEHGINKWW